MRLLLLLLPATLLSAAAIGQGRTAGAHPAKTAPKVAAKSVAPPPAPAPATPVPETFAVTVSGSITDAEGLPLAGATVWHGRSRQILAIANAQGEFTLNLPTNTAVTLTCGYAGFRDQQVQLSRPHRNNDLSISLEPATTPTSH